MMMFSNREGYIRGRAAEAGLQATSIRFGENRADDDKNYNAMHVYLDILLAPTNSYSISCQYKLFKYNKDPEELEYSSCKVVDGPGHNV